MKITNKSLEKFRPKIFFFFVSNPYLRELFELNLWKKSAAAIARMWAARRVPSPTRKKRLHK